MSVRSDNRSRRQRSTNKQRRRGSALVETAMTLPVCLLLIFGIMEYGRYLMMMHLINNAAREGARYAVSHTEPVIIEGVTYGSATSDVIAVVDKFVMGKRLVGQATTVYLADSAGNSIGSWNSADAGESICVQIKGQFQWFTPTLLKLPSKTNVQVRVMMRSESN